MKFSQTILAIAALFAVSTITPMRKYEATTPEYEQAIQYSMAMSKLQQYTRDLQTQLRGQLANPNQRRYAIGALLLTATELGIPEADLESDVLTCLKMLNLNEKDMQEAEKLLGLMIFQRTKSKR